MFDISLIICTRNRCAALRRCIDAVSKTVAAMRWQIVVVDNGSTDATAEYLAGLPHHISGVPVTLIYESRQGLAIARNAGWRASSGNIIAFTDDDCYVAADFIHSVARVFSDSPDVGFIGGRILLHDPSDQKITILDHAQRRAFESRSFIAPGAISGANMAFRRRTLEMIGGFDERMGAGTPFPCEDIDAAAAALWLGIPGAYDPGPTVFHAHGRKTDAEVRALRHAYEGGGSYYVKRILNRQSRSLYLKAWAHSFTVDLRNRGRIHAIGRLRRELSAGFRFALTAPRHPNRHTSDEAISAQGR